MHGFGLDRRRLLVGLEALGVAGCGAMKPDSAAEALGTLAYSRLVGREDDALEAMLAPAARGPHDRELFDKMRGLIPKGEPAAPKRLSWRAFAGTGGQTLTYQHLYSYGREVVVATSVLKREASGWTLVSLNVNTAFADDPVIKQALAKAA